MSGSSNGWGYTIRFAEHAHAERALEELSKAEPPWGVALLYNDRKYDGDGGRGWCIFEGGVCMTVAAHLAAAERMHQLPLRFKTAQNQRHKVIDLGSHSATAQCALSIQCH